MALYEYGDKIWKEDPIDNVKEEIEIE